MRALIAAGLVAGAVATAAAGIVPQQRGHACTAGWEVRGVVVEPGAQRRQPWTGACTDGDPFCDEDGLADGTCRIPVRACSQPTVDACTPKGPMRLRATKATTRVLPDLEMPPLDAGPTCGPWTTLAIEAAAADTPATLALSSKRGRRTGRSRVALRCRPGDPARQCASRGPGQPFRATLSWKKDGSDWDYGFTGESHNFLFVEGRGLDLCLGDCSGTTCQARGASADRLAAPIPLLTNMVPVCVDPRLASTPAGTLDLATGRLVFDTTLAADVYVLQPGGQVCPRCSGDGTIGSMGTCQGGRNVGDPCVVDALTVVVGSYGSEDYQLSSDCPPSGSPAGTLALPITLTTGEARLEGSRPCPGQQSDDSCSGPGTCSTDCSATPTSKGGVNQTCCSDNPLRPCFPTAPDAAGAIVRTGTPAALVPASPDAAYPQQGDGVLVQAACISPTTDLTVDVLTGLPGPLVWQLPFSLTVASE